MIFPLRRRKNDQDESIANFFRRRFNKHIAENLVSALVHGVYAGDYETLSMRTTFLQGLWKMEREGKRLNASSTPEEDILLSELKESMGEDLVKTAMDSAMYSFPDGLETISRRLKEKLKGTQVHIRTDTPVQSIKHDKEGIQIRTPLQSQVFSHLITTIPLPKLSRILPARPDFLLRPSPVTVGVINLYYPKGSVELPIKGFGYLIPKTTPEENPESALGAIIVSDVLQGQDEGKFEGGVKLTVLLGGHYWSSRKSYPSDDELLVAAKTVVARDLGITREPTITQVTLQRDCIPQYEVGHLDRMAHLDGYLTGGFGWQTFKMVGSAIDGVGVNDCILSARRKAKSLYRWSEGLDERFNDFVDWRE
jgi:protoporphyrinogen/coproporphyrinogen III oxidase